MARFHLIQVISVQTQLEPLHVTVTVTGCGGRLVSEKSSLQDCHKIIKYEMVRLRVKVHHVYRVQKITEFVFSNSSILILVNDKELLIL